MGTKKDDSCVVQKSSSMCLPLFLLSLTKIPVYRRGYPLKRTKGGVYLAAQELKQVLEEKHGIRTISSDKIHDGANFNFAYGQSLDTARIYLIIGTDGNLPYPNWQRNKAYADNINARMNAMYPGLSRGVKQDIYRYNQHLHDHAILIEVGGVQNSLEEAKRVVELFADVMAEVINEKNN